jgi:hypothetical protein
MTSVARILAVWLTPAALLAVPAALATRAADGLWLGLTLSLVPLVTLGLASGRRAAQPGAGREALFPVVILLLTVGVLLWANIALAGDVAVWLGRPRWQGIVVTAALGWLLTAWRALRKGAPLLLAIALIAAAVPLLQIAWASGLGPIAAWDRVATQPAFRFPPSSPWVTTGRELAAARGKAPLVFDEVHRLTAPAGGALRARTLDGTRLAEIEWTLSPGQVITLRAGDELARRPSLRLRFEADKHVPGAPPSGMAWADDRPRQWLRRLGLLVTLLVGSAALLRAGLVVRLSRDGVGFVAGGLLVALVWAQAWAVYAMLNAPDVLLGGITLERLLELPGPTLFAEPWRRTLQGFLLIAALAAFLASSVALRERLGALDPTGGGEIGRDPGLWAGLFGGAALASLWPVDPWALTLLALGGAGCALGPATLAPPRRAALGTTAGLLGLIVFAVAAAAQLRGAGGGLLGAVIAYPALAGAPAGGLLLWLGRARR